MKDVHLASYSKEGHRNDPRTGTPLLERMADRVDVIQGGQEKELGRDQPFSTQQELVRWRQTFLAGPVVTE